MIPKHIIEKAIAGGYEVPSINLYYTDGGEEEKKTPEHIAYEAEFRGMWHVIAPDPDFWSALHKAFGWDDEEGLEEYKGVRRTVPAWEIHSHDFYDLILHKASQEEIDKFWKSL